MKQVKIERRRNPDAEQIANFLVTADMFGALSMLAIFGIVVVAFLYVVFL